MNRESFRELCRARRSRARLLAHARPEAAEPLRFFAEVASFQSDLSTESPLASRASLVELVTSRGPAALAEAARALDDRELERAVARFRAREPVSSRESFFARVLLQPSYALHAPSPQPSGGRTCPSCGHPPQVGCLRPLGDGTELTLVCSLCFGEWRFGRGTCSGCGADDPAVVGFYESPELPQLRVATCDRCRRYLHLVRFDVEPGAVPDADEVAGLALDLWATERGYEKLTVNLVGY